MLQRILALLEDGACERYAACVAAPFAQKLADLQILIVLIRNQKTKVGEKPVRVGNAVLNEIGFRPWKRCLLANRSRFIECVVLTRLNARCPRHQILCHAHDV